MDDQRQLVVAEINRFIDLALKLVTDNPEFEQDPAVAAVTQQGRDIKGHLDSVETDSILYLLLAGLNLGVLAHVSSLVEQGDAIIMAVEGLCKMPEVN